MNLFSQNYRRFLFPSLLLAPFAYYTFFPKFILFKTAAVTNNLTFFPLDWIFLAIVFIVSVRRKGRWLPGVLALALVFVGLSVIGFFVATDRLFTPILGYTLDSHFSHTVASLRPDELRLLTDFIWDALLCLCPVCWCRTRVN